MSTQPWYEWSTFNTELAQLIRACLRHESQLLLLDKWLPFPQSSCSFAFGEERRPLPIGALFLLWKNCPEFTTPCKTCSGRVYGYMFGGYLNQGKISATCGGCSRKYAREIGGLCSIHRLVGPPLKNTEFQITGGSLGGCFAGPREPLCRTLFQLGERELPSRSWVKSTEEPEFFLRMGGKRVRFDFDRVIKGGGTVSSP